MPMGTTINPSTKPAINFNVEPAFYKLDYCSIPGAVWAANRRVSPSRQRISCGRASDDAVPEFAVTCPHNPADLERDANLNRMVTAAIDTGLYSYATHVNPQWVRLLDLLEMNVHYERCVGTELFTSRGRRILDFFSGYCVHNIGHN